MDITPLLIKMNSLETDTVQAIAAHCSALLASRLDTRVTYGRTATYEYQGVLHQCRIEKVNQKSANVVEISPKPGRKVRVSISMLKVDPIERAAPKAVSVAVPHRPATASGGAGGW